MIIMITTHMLYVYYYVYYATETMLAEIILADLPARAARV